MMSGGSRMKLCVLFDYGEGVEAWGKRWPDTRDHTETHPKMVRGGSIRQGMERYVVCRGEESWVSGLKVGVGGRWWKQENPKTDPS